MALGDPYATLTQLRDRMGLDDTADDARLTSALATVSRGIENVTGRQFNDAGSAAVRVLEPDSRTAVAVHDFSTTTGLVVSTDADGDGVFETTWTAADYELRPLNGIRSGLPGWPYDEIRAVGTSKRFPCGLPRRATVQVAARWGWAAVPAPVYEACLVVSAETVKLRDAVWGVAGYGDYGAIRVRNNPVAMGMLAPYCLPLIA